MKIGISTTVVQRGKTGIAQYLFALLRGFGSAVPSQPFTLFVLEEDRPLFDSLGEQFDIVPIPERERPPVRNIRWHQSELPKIAGRLGLDVLHIPSYRRLLFNSPCARVATIHDLAPFHVRGKYDLARMFYGRVVVKALARRQHEIIAVSQNTADDIERFFKIPADRVRVIHNGIEHDRFFPRKRPVSLKFANEKFALSKPFFLYVARLEHPGKNHVRLIKAFEKFKSATGSDWQLVFGGSDWHGAEAIHSCIAASSFGNDIRSLGFISNADLPMLYSAADVFVYPSLFEGFGLPPLEAMASGTPVIASRNGSLAEVLADAAILINPENVEEIADALTRSVTSAHLRETYISRGLNRAADFSWERTARETFRVYESAYQRTRGISIRESSEESSPVAAARGYSTPR